ncbi:acylphosphatase [bacterium]|nr:acylphosphatase [bacterium]RQV97943.1 MAG: acylphosphatase [bacterium]
MDAKAHIIVSGMVQGVGYRFFVQKHARHLGLGGWVKNLPSGEVEILAEGDKSRIEILVKSLRTGNPYAAVRNIQVNWSEYQGKFTGFDITF